VNKIFILLLLMFVGTIFGQDLSGQNIFVHTLKGIPTLKLNGNAAQTFKLTKPGVYSLKLSNYSQWNLPAVVINGKSIKIKSKMFGGKKTGHIFNTPSGWVFSDKAPQQIWFFNPWVASAPAVKIGTGKVVKLLKTKDSLMCGWYGFYIKADSDPEMVFYDYLNQSDPDDGVYGDRGKGSAIPFKMGLSDPKIWIHNDGIGSIPKIENSQKSVIGQCGYAIALVVYDWSYTRNDFEFHTYAGNPNGTVSGSGAVNNGSIVNGCRDPKPTLGMVKESLGSDGLPVPNGKGKCKNAKVKEWFKKDPIVNNMKCIDLPMELTDAGLWQYDSYTYDNSRVFFPINDFNPWGDQKLTARVVLKNGTVPTIPGKQNFHFCSQTKGEFIYNAGQKFTFSGDDDFWLFVDGKLALDLGGVHPLVAGNLILDDLATKWKWEEGSSHELAIFHCERNTDGSNFKIQSNIFLKQSKGVDCEVNPNSGVTSCNTTLSASGDCASWLNGDSTAINPSNLIFILSGYFGGDTIKADTLSEGTHYSAIELLSTSEYKINFNNISGLATGRYTLRLQEENYPGVFKDLNFSVNGAGGVVNASDTTVLADTPVMVIIGNILDGAVAEDTMKYTLSVSPEVKVYRDQAMTTLALDSLVTGENGLDTLWMVANKYMNDDLVAKVGVSGGTINKTINFIIPRLRFTPVDAPIGDYAYLDHAMTVEAYTDQFGVCASCEGDTISFYTDVLNIKVEEDGGPISSLVLDGTAKASFFIYVDSAAQNAFLGAEVNDNDGKRSIERPSYKEISEIDLIEPPTPHIENAFVFDSNGDGIADRIEIVFDRDITDSIPEIFSTVWPLGNTPVSYTAEELMPLLQGGTTFVFEGPWKDTIQTQGFGRVNYTYKVGDKPFKLKSSIVDKMGPVISRAEVTIPPIGSSEKLLITFSEPIWVDSVNGDEFELVEFLKDSKIRNLDYSFVGWSDSNQFLKYRISKNVELENKAIVNKDSIRISFTASAFNGQIKDTLGNYANVSNRWVPIIGDKATNISTVELVEVNFESLKDSTEFTTIGLPESSDIESAFEATKHHGLLIPYSVFSNLATDKDDKLIDPDSLEIEYNIQVYSHLGEAVSYVSETVLCSDTKYFEGNCHTNPKALYIQWNYQDKESRLVGAGVYFVKMNYTMKVVGLSKGGSEFENSWGVSRTTEVENARVVK
jgi:fibro-slime domain-containing protein